MLSEPHTPAAASALCLLMTVTLIGPVLGQCLPVLVLHAANSASCMLDWSVYTCVCMCVCVGVGVHVQACVFVLHTETKKVACA